MKKTFALLLFFTIILFASCNGDSAATPSTETPAEPSATEPLVIKEISDIDAYSYIGVGTDNQADNEDGSKGVHQNMGKRILGIRKSDGKAEAVRFKDKNGNLMPKSPCVTAELTTESFSFYKLSYETTDYYEADFSSAPGDMYCFCSDNGCIYKLEGITSLYSDLGNYDCYDGTFVGSFVFSDASERLCKVYIKDGNIKIDKKIDIKDFPEFKNVFMDRNKNVFAWEKSFSMCFTRNLTNWFNLKYILSNTDKIYKAQQSVILAYNRVVYGANTVQYMGDEPNYSYVKTLKDKLAGCYLVNNEFFYLDSFSYDIEELSDGSIHCISNGKGSQYTYNTYGTEFTVKPYYDIDVAYTTDFIPPELNHEGMHGDPYHTWGYSELLDVIDGKYIYLTKGTESYGLTIVDFSDGGLKYSANFCPNVGKDEDTTKVWGDEISLNWAYADGKIYYFRDDELRVVDIAKETNTVFSNPDIVKYHSIEKVNNNKVGFLGTNSYGNKVYYEINTADDSIKLLGDTPTFSSVSFRPINR